MLKAAGKKGNMFLEAIMVVVVLTVLGLITLVGYMMLSDWNDEIQADPDISNWTKNLTRENVEDYHSAWDGAILFLVVLLWIAVVVSAYLIDANPVFFVIALIALAFVLIFAAQMSNAYTEFAEDADLAASAAKFPYTKWIFDHLVAVVMAMAFSVGLALYAKIRGGGGG